MAIIHGKIAGKGRLVLRVFVLILLGLAGAYLLLISPIGMNWVRGVVESRVNERIYGELSLGNLRSDLFTRLSVEGISLRTRAPGGQDVFRAERVELEYHLLPLIRRGAVKRLSLSAPACVLDIDETGRSNLDGLLPRREVDSSPSRPLRIPIPDSLRLDDGVFSLVDRRSGWTLTLMSIELHESRPRGEPGGAGTLHIPVISLASNTFRDSSASFSAAFRISPDSLNLTACDLSAGCGIIRAEGALSLPGASHFRFAGAITADLSQIRRCVPSAPRMSGEAQVWARAASAPGHRDIEAEVLLEDARFPWGDVPAFRARLTVADSLLSLGRCSGQMNGGTLEMDGTWHLSASRPSHQARIALDSVDLRPLLEHFLPGRTLAGLLDLDLEFRGQGLANPISEARGDVRLGQCEIGELQIGDAHLEGTYQQGAVALLGNVGTVTLNATGTLAPDADLDLRLDAAVRDSLRFLPLVRMEPGGEATLTARLHGRLSSPRGTASLRARSFRVGAFQCDDLLATLDVDSARVARVELGLNEGEVRLTGGLDMRQRRLLPTRLAIDRLDLAERVIPLGSVRLGGAFSATLDAEGGLDRLRAGGRLHLEDACWRGQPLGDFDGDLSFSEDALDAWASYSVLNAQLASADSALSARASLALAPDRHLDGALSLELFPLDPLLGALDLPQAEGMVSLRAQLSGPLGDLVNLQGHASLDTLAMTIDGTSLYAPHKAQVTLQGGRLAMDDWELVAGGAHLSMGGALGLSGPQEFRLDVGSLPLDLFGLTTPWGDSLKGVLEGSLVLGGPADSLDVNGRLQWAGVDLFGVDTLTVHIASGEGEARTSILCRQAGSGQLAGDVVLPWHLSFGRRAIPTRRGHTQIWASADGFRIPSVRALLPRASEHLEGLVHGRADFNGDAADWQTWTGKLMLDTLRVAESGTALENVGPVEVELDHGAFELTSLAMAAYHAPMQDTTVTEPAAPSQQEPQLRAQGTFSLLGVSDVTLAARALDLRVPAAFLGLEDRLRGRLDMNVTWSGPADDPQVSGDIRLADGTLHPLEIGQLAVAFAYADQQVVLEDARLVLANQTVHFDGTIPVDLRLSRPADPGPRKELRIAARAPWLDLSQLPIKASGLARLKGQLYVDAHLGGTLQRPIGTADIRANGVEVKLKALDDAFSFDRLAVSMDSTAASLSTEGGRLGVGELAAAARMSLEPETQGTFTVTVRGADVPVRVPRNVDLTANVDLDWKGRFPASKCSGRVEIKGGVFRRPLSTVRFSPFRDRVERPKVSPGPVLKAMELDVALMTTSPLQVRTDLIEVPLTGSIHIAGTAARPAVLGSIESGEGGYLYYLDRRFLVDHLGINSNSTYQFDPELALKAHTELLDILDLKPYTITLDVTGRIPRPTVHLSSDPALGPLDIASLLTLGTTQSGFLGGDQTARALIADRSRDLAIQRAMGLTSQQFGRILGTYGINVNAHASDVSEWAGARIRLDKQLTQRMVVVYTTSVGGSVSQRVQVDYRLTDYLSLETQTDENGDSGIDLRFKYRF